MPAPPSLLLLLLLLLLPPPSSALLRPFRPSWVRADDASLFSQQLRLRHPLDCAAACAREPLCSGFVPKPGLCRLLFSRPQTSLEFVSGAVERAWRRPDLPDGSCGYRQRFRGAAYRLVQLRLNFSAARESCATSGGWLAVLRDPSELRFVESLSPNATGVLVGATLGPKGWNWGRSLNSSEHTWLWANASAPRTGPAAVLEGGRLRAVAAEDEFWSVCECPRLRHFENTQEAVAEREN